MVGGQGWDVGTPRKPTGPSRRAQSCEAGRPRLAASGAFLGGRWAEGSWVCVGGGAGGWGPRSRGTRGHPVGGARTEQMSCLQGGLTSPPCHSASGQVTWAGPGNPTAVGHQRSENLHLHTCAITARMRPSYRTGDTCSPATRPRPPGSAHRQPTPAESWPVKISRASWPTTQDADATDNVNATGGWRVFVTWHRCDPG